MNIVGENMNRAFILVNSEMGTDISGSLRAIPGVKNVYGVYGVYDFVIYIEAENTDMLKEIVNNKIRRVEGARSTLTMIVIE